MRKIWVVAAALIAVSMTGPASADSGAQPDVPLLQVGQSTLVQGMVQFQERHTVVPLSYCGTFRPCPKSQPYWTVSLKTETATYEIDQRFDAGQSRQPESVQIGGIVVRPGSVLRLVGTVEYASPTYYIIGDVRNVAWVMNYVQSDSLSLPNWSCHGNLDRNTEIQVAVWYTGRSAGTRSNRYGLRLIGSDEAVDGHHFYSLAALDNAQARDDSQSLVYEGSNASASVQLVIAQNSDQPKRNVMSKLRFSLSRLPSDGIRIPPQTEMDVICNRIR